MAGTEHAVSFSFDPTCGLVASGSSVDEAAQSAFTHFVCPPVAVEVATIAEGQITVGTPSTVQISIAHKAGDDYFTSGVLVEFPMASEARSIAGLPARRLYLSLHCTDVEAGAFLEDVRASLGTAQTRKHSALFPSADILREALAATALLHGRPGQSGIFARRVAETRLLALSLTKAPPCQLLHAAGILVAADPTFAPSRLHQSNALLKAGRAHAARAEAWFAILMAGGERETTRLEEKALALLGMCQRVVGVVGVRLDTAESVAGRLVARSRDNDEVDACLDRKLPCCWTDLSAAQKERHRQLVPKIPLTEPVPLRDRQTRVAVISNSKTSAELQRFFSWVVPHRFAVGSTPRNPGDILAAEAIGFRTVITLTMEEPLPAAWFNGSSVRNVRLPVPNMRAPSVQQVDAFLVELLGTTSIEGEQLLLHCGGGKGRAGTFAAAYLMLFGTGTAYVLCENCMAVYCGGKGRSQLVFNNCLVPSCGLTRREPAMTSGEAVELIRNLRPGSIESESQRQFLNDYSRELWRRALTDEQGKAPPECIMSAEADAAPLEVVGKLPVSFPRLIVLCGVRMLATPENA